MGNITKDINNRSVSVGTKVRILSLSGQWLENLPQNEKQDILSMIGETFVVEEIDEYGKPWICKSWQVKEGENYCHHISLNQN